MKSKNLPFSFLQVGWETPEGAVACQCTVTALAPYTATQME